MLHPTDGEVPVTAEEAPALEQGDGLVKTSAGELFGAHSALKERGAAALVERGEEVVGAEKAAALVEVEAKEHDVDVDANQRDVGRLCGR